MTGIRRYILSLAFQVLLVVNISGSSTSSKGLPTVIDATVDNGKTHAPARTAPSKTQPSADAQLTHLTPSKGVNQPPETSPIETQLTESVTQTNTEPNAIGTTAAAVKLVADVGKEESSTSDAHQTTDARTREDTLPGAVATETQSELSPNPGSSVNNVLETARTSKVLTVGTDAATDIGQESLTGANRQSTSSGNVELPGDVTTEVNTATDVNTATAVNMATEHTSDTDLSSDKGTTVRDRLTRTDTTVSRSSTDKGSLTIDATTVYNTPLSEEHIITRPDETTSIQSPFVIKETTGLSGTPSRDPTAAVDGSTVGNVIATAGDVIAPSGDKHANSNTTIVPKGTASPNVAITEIINTDSVMVNRTGNGTNHKATVPPVLTTVAPMTTFKQTTLSPLLAPPRIDENPKITTSSIEICLSEPVEGAAQYVALADTVPAQGFYLEAGQMETDMDDDFDMSMESSESDKEVEWEDFEEQHYNYTIVPSEGASLCAPFGNLTAGMKYNFTVQAMRSPTLPPESFSQIKYVVTAPVAPVLMPPIVRPRSVQLRWFFDRQVFVQYYNVTYRWGDQIGFSITNLAGSQLEWTVYGLMAGGTYTFRVIAATPFTSAFSEITRTTELFQPRVYVLSKTVTSINVAWTYDDDTFVEHYTIKYTLLKSNMTKVVMLPGPWVEDNSFNVSGLISGGRYRVILIAESRRSSKTSEINITTELYQPRLDFTFTNQTSLGLNWGFNNQKVLFEYFNFSYLLIPGNYSSSVPYPSPRFPPRSNSSYYETILPLWQENLEVNNLIPGARYTFQIQAVGDLNMSPFTRIVKATKPETPTGLMVLRFDTNSIELGWNQTHIDHVEFFKILYRSVTTSATRIAKSLGPVKTLRRLSPGDTYRIYVSTRSWGEESGSAMVEQQTKLKGPMVVSAANYSDNAVTVVWSIPPSNVVGEWTIWCEGPGCNLESSDTYIYIKSHLTSGQHTFEGLRSGEHYHFVVNVWSELENLEGSVAQTTAPGRPLNLKVIDFSETTISITWAAPINSTVTEYLVTYQGMMESMTANSTFSFVRRSLGANLKNLSPGDFYIIKVQSVTNGALSWPVEDIQSTKLAQVSGAKAHTITNNTVILEWVSAKGYYDNVRVGCTNCTYTEVSRSVPKTSNRIMFTNLKSGSIYVFKLITMRNGFLDGHPVSYRVATYPDSPGIVYIDSISDRHISLKWSGTPCEGCNVDYYNIDKMSDDGEALHTEGVTCPMLVNGNEKVCMKSFTKLHPGHFYTFAVTAVSGGLRSPRPYIFQQRTKPAIPGEISFDLIDKRSLTVAWQPSEGLVDSYIINIRMGQENVDESREVAYNMRQQQFRRLLPGRPYTVTIIATVAGLLSSARSVVVHTQPDIPGRVLNFRVKATSPVEVLATFSIPTDPNGVIEAYYMSYYGITDQGKPCPSVLDKKLPGNLVKATIGSLHAGCNYTFTIAASTGAGRGRAVTQYLRTPISAPQPTGRVPGVPPSDAIFRESFKVTFDTTFFDEAYGEITTYSILVAESSIIPSTNSVERKNSSIHPVLMTWAQAFEYDITPKYQISDPFIYAELFEGETGYSRRSKRDAVYSRDIIIGKDSCPTVGKGEYCNGHLKPGRTYVYQFRGLSKHGFSDTKFSPPIQLPSDQTGLIVGISVVLVLLFVIVLILAIMVIGRRWKYIPLRGKYMLASTNEPLTDTLSNKGCRASKIKFSRPVRVSEFCQDYHAMNAHSHYGFSQEYEAIRKIGKKMNCNAAVLPDNVSKNRYTNILPYDKTRVKLSSIDDDEGSDYINANYIPGFNSPREFIACQGPLPGTTDDTWKMIWEHNVTSVVMVTQLVEKGKVKCDQYWPEDHKPILYGEVQVTMTSVSELKDWTVREFTLLKADSVKKLRHFNYLSWPDHGVPDSSDILLGFIKSVRQQIPRNGTPTVVHCSAGVGRTGTYVCLDRIQHEIEDADYIDIMAIVAEMRMHRNYMVQTEQQYVFIHRCVLDMLAEKGIAPSQMPSAINGDAAEHSCKV